MKGGAKRALQFVMRTYLKLFLAIVFLAVPSFFFSAIERSVFFDILLISSSTLYLIIVFLVVYFIRKAGRKKVGREFKIFVLQIYLIKLIVFLVHTIFNFDYNVIAYLFFTQIPIMLMWAVRS